MSMGRQSRVGNIEMKEVDTHPVQVPSRYKSGESVCPKAVTMRAYEVYCHVYGEQEALVTGGCRGGFSTGELIAFLYAHSFPKDEWDTRHREAFTGAENI